MTSLSDLEQETYLGDGLYVSFDEYGIKLRAPQPQGGDQKMWLTMGDTLSAFLAYVDDLKVKLSNILKEQAKEQEK